MTIVGSTTLRFLEILPPASSYIIIPPGGIIMYGLAGGTILKSWNVVDTNYSILCLESLFDNSTPILSKSNIINSPRMIHSLIISRPLAENI